MGVFDNLFGSSKKVADSKKSSFINWIPLTEMEQLTTIKHLSEKEPIAIFKHSTRCGISSMVIKRFENNFDETLKDFKVYYLDLLNYRAISNEIASQFQVMHQSPQLLVIKKGEVLTHASHYDIASVDLKKI